MSYVIIVQTSGLERSFDPLKCWVGLHSPTVIANISASQRPWYLISISFMSWLISFFLTLFLSLSLSLLVAHWLPEYQEIDPYMRITLILHPRFPKAVIILATSSVKFFILMLPRKFFTTRANAFYASNSTSFIQFLNSGPLLRWRIWAPSMMPYFNSSVANPGKAWHKWVKQLPSLPRALVRCLTKPNMMRSGGESILPLPTEGWFWSS